MRTAIFNGKGTISVEERPKPSIKEPTDAIVRVVLACVCGSDLWFYRGVSDLPHGSVGHEFIGVVDELGDDVKNLSIGDFVISPFTWSDGTCENCQAGFPSACIHGGVFGQGGQGDGGQAEFVRVPQADGTLFTVPGSDFSDETMASFLALTDVMATGYHAAVSAEVEPGDAVAVVGDGAVGLCAVLSAKELTDGYGADAVMECVGGKDATDTAFAIAKAGAVVGRVGIPHDATVDANVPFFRNVGTRGGPSPARFYQPRLVEAVLRGEINPGTVFDLTVALEDIAEGYAAMHERRAIKALVKVSELSEVSA